MQGKRAVILLIALMVLVIGAGLWLGFRESPGRRSDDRSGTSSRAPAPEEPLPPAPVEGPRAEPGHGKGRLVGRVLLFQTKQPVRDVIVGLSAGPAGFSPRQGVSDEEGWVRFDDLPAGVGYEILVSHGEFAPVRRLDLSVVNAEITDAGVLFLERAVTFKVRVMDGGRKPIPGAQVSIYSSAGPASGWNPNSWIERILKATEVPTPVFSAKAGEDGEAEIAGLPAGYYSVAAEASGYARAGAERLLSPDSAEEPVEIVLGKGYQLSGSVTDADGEPVAGVVLATPASDRFTWNQGFLRKSAAIDEQGRYEFADLRPGASRLVVVPEGLSAVPVGNVSIPDLETYDIRLGAGAVIHGRVEDEAGEAVAGAEIRAMVSARGGNQTFGATALSGEEGEFRIEGLPTGNMNSLEVIADGFARYPPPSGIRETVFLSPGTEINVVVTMKQGYELKGKVTRDSDEKPLAGARVSAIPRAAWGGTWEVTTTGDDGAYSLAALSPGEYAIQVVAEGAYQPEFPSPWQAQRPQYKLDDRWKVRIEEGTASVTRDLVLSLGGVVSGRVEDSNGEPVAGVNMSLSNRTASVPNLSEKDGSFTFTGVKEGDRLYVNARVPGRSARSDRFGIGPAGRVEGLLLTLKASATIAGQVELPGGAVAEGGAVRVVYGDPRRNPWILNRGRSGTTTIPIGGDGSFRVENVNPGQITVVASVPGYPPGFSETLRVDQGAEILGVSIALEEGLTLTGTVTTKRGDPVAEAQISVYKDRAVGNDPWMPVGFGGGSVTVAQSDAEGRFAVTGISTGKYRVTAKKEGLTAATATGVNPSAGDEIRLEMDEGGEIQGVVLDNRNEPVSGLTVSLKVTAGRQQYGLPMTSTSTDGTFSLTGVPEGSYKLVAAPGWGSKLNYTTAVKEGVRPGETGLELRVRPGFPISGRVVDPDGRPASGLMVYASGGGSDQPVSKYVQVQHDGKFEITGLPEGRYQVMVQAGGGGLANTTVKGVAAGTEGLDIMLVRAMNVEGVVVGPDGMPVRSVQVQAQPMPGTAGSNGWANTSRDGRYTIRNLAEGSYRLTFRAPGRFVTAVLVEIPAGSGGVNVQMDEGMAISGVATDRDGIPIQGISVTAVSSDPPTNASASTDREGKFKIKGLGEGKVSLTARGGQGFVLEKPMEVQTGKEDVKLVLDQGLSIRGTLVDASGKGIQWAWMEIKGRSGRYAQTDKDGNFAFEGLKPGTVKIQIWAPSFATRKIVEIQAGDNAVRIRLE